MLFSRFWILLLAVVSGLSLAAMTLARRTYEHDRAQDAATMLGTDRKLLDEFLRREARSRLDDLTPVAANARLVELMEAASRRTDDTTAAIGPGITAKLRELNHELGPLTGDVLLAVDLRGVVVGRVGLNEGEVGQNLGGLPLVEKAVAGYVRDDVWEIAGQAYRMAARPVISQGRYYVGAIVHGMAVNQHFVDTVAQAVPGAAVMFFGPTGPYASTTPVVEAGGHPPPPIAVLADQLRAVRERGDWQAHGVTEAVTVADPAGLAVYGSLPGMVGASGGGFAVARGLPLLPADFLLHASRPDLARVPWGLIVLFGLGAVVLGWALVWVEFDSKRRKLHLAFAALAREGTDRLDPLVLSGFARELAVMANEGIEEVVRREVERAAGRRRNVGELESLLTAQSSGAAGAVSAPPSIPLPRYPDFPGAASPSLPSTPSVPERDVSSATSPIQRQANMQVVAMPGTVPGTVQSPAQPPSPPPVPANVRRAVSADDDDQPTGIAPVPVEVRKLIPGAINPSLPDGVQDEQKHWREVYEQFAVKRKECGEASETPPYEKFAATLQRHKDQLVARTGCRTVHFQVYVKDGKATLKATSVK